MTDQVQEVKKKADIVTFIAERMKLQKAGRNWRGLCPFHSEKTPSFNVSPELQIFKCFGCSKSGDVFSFLEEYEGMDFPEALRYVADRVGVKLVEYRVTPQSQQRGRALEILNLAAEFYHYLLMEHKVGEVARQYLKERGIWKQTMDTWRLGYAPLGWDNLYKYLVGKKKYIAEEAEKVGLIVRSNKNYYDRFRGRIMFPLANQRGQVLGLAGRLLDKDAKEAKYVNSPETELYHKSELLFGLSVTREDIKKTDRVVVVEGEFDAISSWQQGVKNVVAIKGSAFTQEQIQLLSRYTHNVALSLDADLAGDEATRRSIALADRAGMNVRVVELSGGKDPDEIARNDKEKWKQLVAEAVNVYDFYLNSTLKRWDAKTGEGKREITRSLMPILARITNGVEQSHYILKLAKALGVTEEVLLREMQRVGMSDTKLPSYQVTRSTEEKTKESGGMVLEEYTVGLLFASEERLGELLSSLKLEWFDSAAVKKLLKYLFEVEKFNVGTFVEGLPDELKELAQRIWLRSGELVGVDIAKEFSLNIKLLKRRFVRAHLADLTAKIKALESKRGRGETDRGQLKKMREEFVVTSREIGH